MRRAAKICFWAIIGQTHAAIVNPVHLVGLLISLVIIIPLFVTLCFCGRRRQVHVIGGLLSDSRLPPYARARLHAMIDLADAAELSGHAGHQIICWDCHHAHECQPPKRGETLDHGCHRGECPHAKLQRDQ